MVLRAEQGWTQQDWADRLGITRQSVASIEKGKYSLSLKLAVEISKVFNKRLEEVFLIEYDN